MKQKIQKLLKSNLNKKKVKAELYSLLNPTKLIKEHYCELWNTRANPHSGRSEGFNFWKRGKIVYPKNTNNAVNIDNVKNVRGLAIKYLKNI